MKQPCVKDCPNRSPTCHGDCEKYLEYFEHRREISKMRVEDETTGYLKSSRQKRKSRWQYNNKNK